MSYLVTARKWRPQKFSEIVGQEHITTTLKNALKSNRLAHAYIFTGSRGVGKTTTARILAKAINCLNPIDYEPCNQCEICKSINEFQSLDIIEIDGASNRGIDDIRNLRESVRYAPTLGKYKVYIIDEVHMLTTESFNAFLKTLEEPPSHTIFIFATTDIHKVPLTIISRCQRFDFKRINLNIIKEQLKKIAEAENIRINDQALTIIAKKSDGAMRDAQSFFDQVIAFCGEDVEADTVAKILNIIDQEIYFRISDAIIEKDFKSAFEVIELIHNNGWDYSDFIEGLIEHFRNILSVLITEKSDLLETAEIYVTKYLNYLNRFTKSDILRSLNFLIRNQSELKFSNNKKVKVEIILSHLIGLQNSSTISEIINEIQNQSENNSLEKKKQINSDKKNSDSYVKQKAENLAKSEKEDSLQENIKIKEFNFENSWKTFIEEVTKEKALVLGSLIKSLEPVKFENNTILIKDIDNESKHILEINNDFIEKKLNFVFGRKIKLGFINSSKKQTATNTPSGNQTYSNPIEKIIIEELGGKKIL
jgi:DNA polymerase-3 subunit gamma/tau